LYSKLQINPNYNVDCCKLKDTTLPSTYKLFLQEQRELDELIVAFYQPVILVTKQIGFYLKINLFIVLASLIVTTIGIVTGLVSGKNSRIKYKSNL
jgi:hypothetical protein